MRLLISFFLICTVVATAQNNIDYVDLFIGTAGDHGQLDPAATIPFGQIKVGPDTEPSNHSGYNFEVTRLKGFSINRISGVGCNGAGGNLCIKPLTVINKLQLVNIDKPTEIASPGYYATSLDNGVFAEMTASRAVALQRYTFPKLSERNLSLDLHASFSRFYKATYEQVSNTEIKGSVSATNVCGEGRYTIYFHLYANQGFLLSEIKKGFLLLNFSNIINKAVEVRIAVSSIDVQTAAKENEILTKSFEDVKKDAFRQWKIKMNKIDVYGDESDKKMFYSMLYRQYLSPVDITSYDGRYRGADGDIYNVNNRNFYSSWSIWDTYRTKFPLLNLIEPELMSDISYSLIELYKQGKTGWATMNEPTPTVRTEHAIIVLLDAIEKGIKDVNIIAAYEAMKQEAEYLPVKSPDNKLESAYDLWALSKIAGKLRYMEDSIHYAKRSEEMWTTIWVEKFKTIHSETFDIVHGDGLYEGTLWQYRWAVPYAYDKKARLVGGKDKLKNELTYFFENNLHNQGNQPGIHTPFIFNRLNDNVSTNKWVHKILKGDMKHYYGTHQKNNTPYVGPAYRPIPRAFIPEMDDDDGTMSAWYVFASCGLYPLLPGVSDYELCKPLFRKVVFNIGERRKFIILNESNDTNSGNVYWLNGHSLDNYLLNHHQIVKGGILKITDK